MKLANRAKMSVTGTPGTGTITLNGAASAAQSFASAGIVDGDYVCYTVVDGTAWENGWGLYTASGTSLTRNLLESSTGSLLSLSSSAVVSITPFASSAIEGGGMRNRLINGDMRLDQRNEGASFPVIGSGSYCLDRWAVSGLTSGGTATGQRLTLNAPIDYSNSLQITAVTGHAVASTDLGQLVQIIEGRLISDLRWGASNAKPVTVGFWVKSTRTGTFCVTVLNNAGTLSYVTTYTINVASTWEFKVVSIPGPTSGTWATDNTGGIIISFDLGSGSNFTTTANTWAAGNYRNVAGAVSLLSTTSATLQITGVQLERGTYPTEFERIAFDELLRRCQRYFWKTFAQGVAPAVSAGQLGALTWVAITGAPEYFGRYPVIMRGTPFATFYNPVSANSLVRDYSNSTDYASSLDTNIISDQGFGVGCAAGPSQGHALGIHATFSAEL